MNSFRFSRFPKRPDSPVSPSNLYPVYFADRTEPVLGADGGINLDTFERYDEGLYAVIDPWERMAEGDEVVLFWNDPAILQLKVDSAQVNERLFFYLPTDKIDAGFSTCRYELTRAGETLPDDPSVVLTLFIKLTLPAGEDKEKPYPWHSELDIVGLPLDVINNGVTKEWAASGVPMIIQQYPDMRVRDVIWVCWGSIFLAPHVVTQAEVDGTAEIVVTASPSDILTAGDSLKLLIKYEIHDEVWNFSEKWSKETTVRVEAGAARLGIPIFDDADGGELHLDQLDHQATNLLINIKDNDEFTSGDKIRVNVIGIGRPGTASRTFSIEITVGNPAYIHEVPIPFEFVSLFATGTLDGSYVLLKQDGSAPLYSKRAFVKVIGNPALLPAPTIEEVIGAILPSDSLAATVRIAYPSLKVGDTINMIWEGKKGDGNSYLYEESYDVSGNDEETGFIFIYVMSEHILALINGSLKLYYRVYNEDPADFGLSESDFLRVDVRGLSATLPAPDVEEAKEGVIDLTQVYTQAHVLVKPVAWAKGDILTYHWSGVNPYSSTKGCVPITLLTIDKTVRFRVDARYVTANIGYVVTVRYTLLHVETGKFSYSAPFEVMVGIPLGELKPPTVVQAIGAALNPMDALNGVDIQCSYPTMDVELDTLGLKWRGTPGPGTSENLEQPAEPSGTVSFHLASSFVGANIRRSVNVGYDVQRYGLWTSSQLLPLQILDFQDPEKELPRPEVPQAIDAVLDLMEIAGDASVVVKPWPFIAKGQLASVWLEGLATTGSYVIEVLTAHLITDQQATQGLDEPLPRSELLKLLHSSAAVVKCAVVFDGSTDMSAAIEFPSLPLTIRTRYDYVTPVITKVLNPQGQDIPEAGLTYDKRVTVQGTATRGEKVEIKINDVLKGTPEASALWTWECPADSLNEGLQKITVEALYDADVPVGNPRTFTVGVATKPSITAVNDSKGPVAMDGTTYDSAVTVAVKADPDQLIQLYDSATAIGVAIELDGEGNGSTTLTDLTIKGYAVKARALYGQQLESALHNFAVKAHLAVTLTSVRHSGGDLLNGGATTDSSVTLSGTVTPRYEVQIYDNNSAGPKITGHPSNGSWTTTLGVGLGGHSVYAKALATGQNSNTRTFRRDNPIPPLNFNQNPVTLGGKTYICPAYPHLFPAPNAGNSVRHQASGGSGAISYSSSNPAVAAVDNAGFVTARGRGSALITARDGVNQSKSYTVYVTNVIHCIGLGGGTWNSIVGVASQHGARMPSYDELYEIFSAYVGRWPMGSGFYWSSTPTNYHWPWPGNKTVHLVNGTNASGITKPGFNHSALGVGLR